MRNPLFEEFPPQSLEAWMEKLVKDLKGRPLEKLNKPTEAGIQVSPLHTREGLPKDLEASFPGMDDFRRGHQLLMHNVQPWKISILLNHSMHSDALRFLKEYGGPLGSIRLQLNGRLRRVFADSEEIQLDRGILLQNWEELKELLAWAKGESKEVWLDGGDAIAVLLAEGKDAIFKGLKGGLAYNPLSYGTMDGSWMKDAANFLKGMGDSADFKAFEIDLLEYEQAGASGLEQLAFALSMAVEMAERLAQYGISAGQVFASLSFRFPVGTELLLEIAKLRAFRMLWANLLKAYGLQPEPRYFNLQAAMAKSSYTLADPYVNVLRATSSAISAIFAGADTIELPGHNQYFEDADNASLRIARNIQLVLREESDLGKVIDPAGGSYFVESATEEMAAKAWTKFQEMEAAGGWSKYVASGMLISSLEANATKRTAALGKASKVLLGTNVFPNEREHLLVNEIDPNQLDRIANLKQQLMNSLNQRTLDPSYWIDAPRPAAVFEQLRVEGQKVLPSVFLFEFGNPAMRSARANFSRNLFAAAAFEIEGDKPGDLEASLAKAKELQPNILVFCASDADYQSELDQLLPKLQQMLPKTRLVLAGRPDGWEKWKEIGLSDAIFAGMDRLAFLQMCLNVIKMGGGE